MTIELQLQQDGFMLTFSVGVSMRPMLTQRTGQLQIEKVAADPKVNDVVLFKRSSGQYVLHRVVRKCPTHYLIRGDKFIDCEKDIAYRCYVAFWRGTHPFRLAVHKCLSCIRVILSRLRR